MGSEMCIRDRLIQNSGLIVPYDVGLADSCSENIVRWTTETFAYLKKVYECGDVSNQNIGLSLVHGRYEVYITIQ